MMNLMLMMNLTKNNRHGTVDVEITPRDPLIINSKLKAIAPGKWYRVTVHIECLNVPPGLAYILLIWGDISTDSFIEISRVRKTINAHDRVYDFVEQAPAGSTRVIIAYRANCEDAWKSMRRYHLYVSDPDSCEPMPVSTSYARLLKVIEKLRPRPQTIDLNVELVSYCNLRCRWCALDHNKEKVKMDPDLFKKTLGRVTATGGRVRRIDLHNAGETLLHPKFNELMHVLRSVKSQNPDFPYVALLTNGMMLNDQRSRIIAETGCIDMLRISVDGGTTEEYNKIRVGGDFNQVYNNIMNFIKVNNGAGHNIITGIICIVGNDHPLNIDWMSDEFKTLLSSVDHYELRRPHNWDGSANLGIVEEITNNGRCSFISNNNLVVLPQGQVTVCCADLNSRGVIGNINDSSLDELINCKKRKDMIRFMDKGKRNSIELCQNCNIR